jgi:hypothetical protein
VVRLRIVVWNCHGRLGQKSGLLAELSPDLAVIPECECPEVLLRRTIDLDRCEFAWDGARPDRGLAVLSFGAWRIAIDSAHRPGASSTLPVRVSGPAELLLVAAWAIPRWVDRRSRLASEPLAAGLARLAPLLTGTPAVLAGDFNRSLVTRRGGHLASSPLARRLTDLGLISAYHHARGVLPGHEAEPTFFRLRRFPSPHHLDHVFVDASSAERMVGARLCRSARWMVWSDHAPLVVELALPPAPSLSPAAGDRRPAHPRDRAS